MASSSLLLLLLICSSSANAAAGAAGGGDGSAADGAGGVSPVKIEEEGWLLRISEGSGGARNLGLRFLEVSFSIGLSEDFFLQYFCHI